VRGRAPQLPLSFYPIHPVGVHAEGRGEEGCHGLHEVVGVFHAGGLVAGVHGELGEPDVNGVERNLGVGDVAEGRAAC